MGLRSLRITNVRNIAEAVVHPGPNVNIILGENGSGKSSFLEAIYILARAESFRTRSVSEGIRFNEQELVVNGELQVSGDLDSRVGVRIRRGEKTIRIDGTESFSKARLIRLFPLQFISPMSYQVIEGSPRFRRHFMDWGVFHLEDDYRTEWKRFNRCLSQRNRLLKERSRPDLRAWDCEFVKYGTIVAGRRQDYIRKLIPYMQGIGQQMLPGKELTVDYHHGWDPRDELDIALNTASARDLRFGFSHLGPHKGDLAVKVDGRSCKAYLSRGQIKLLVLVMILAQIKLLANERNIVASLLIDDFCAELDSRNSSILKNFLSDSGLQCFITAMDRNSLGTLCGINSTLFHVERGQVKPI